MSPNGLCFRPATAADHARLRELLLDAFAPITWFRTVDRDFGPLNGNDWRERWQRRLDHVFATQMILIGETLREGIVAVATATTNETDRLGYVDLLAVDPARHRRGLGRRMLEAMLEHLKRSGMTHAYLDCLDDNVAGNALYQAAGWKRVATHHRWFRKLD